MFATRTVIGQFIPNKQLYWFGLVDSQPWQRTWNQRNNQFMSDIGSELASNLLLSLDKWTNTYFGKKKSKEKQKWRCWNRVRDILFLSIWAIISNPTSWEREATIDKPQALNSGNLLSTCTKQPPISWLFLRRAIKTKKKLKFCWFYALSLPT